MWYSANTLRVLNLASDARLAMLMAYPRKQSVTPASLAARRRNARKSTGPRSPFGKARVALNPMKHGISSRSFRATLEKAGESTELYDRALEILGNVLRPRNRLAARRTARYAQMICRLTRRSEKYAGDATKKVFRFPFTRAEHALQNRILKDLDHRLAATPWEERRLNAPYIKLIRFLSGGPGSHDPVA